MRRICVLASGAVEAGEHDCRRRRFKVPTAKAEKMVEAGTAERISEHVIRLVLKTQPSARTTKMRGLSARVGKEIAEGYRAGEPTFVAMMGDISRGYRK
ncbi:MAG: hypothetical protein WCC97_01970 [Candidatus Acidiferrales bacterium]